MNSESTLQSDRFEEADNYAGKTPFHTEYNLYQNFTQQSKKFDKFSLDFAGGQIDDRSVEEEKEEDSQVFHTMASAYDTQIKLQEQDHLVGEQMFKQYQTQNIQRQFLQNNAGMRENSREQAFNVFSNSFDESAPTLDLRPKRNCKSSTRMLNQTYKNQVLGSQVAIPLINGGGILTTGSLNRKQGAFNTYMRSKQQMQQQNQSYQQQILNQIQRANTQNSFDQKNGSASNQDLTNRSAMLTPNGAQVPGNINCNSFTVNSFVTSNKPITPHTATPNLSSMILSAGSQMNPRNGQAALNCSTMDPYTYLKWKQQKYKSCRSIQANPGQIQKQATGNINISTYMVQQQRKGNQTQKTKKTSCSSNDTSSTNITGAIKSLSEVKNPQLFISFRFTDRKVTELVGISNFKNLTELDISGNYLTQEIQELKILSFLKKLNLSNNTIQELYCLPSNLEILNLSYNQLKRLNPEAIAALKNLTTLDLSNNGLESLDGVQGMKRLKRLLSKNNQIENITPLTDLTTLVEIDLENNPIDSYEMLLNALQNKKDILVINLKLSPIMLTIQSFDQLLQEMQHNYIPENQTEILKKKLKFFHSSCLYRSKRVFQKIRSMQMHSKRSSSNFSNGSSSCGRAGAAQNHQGSSNIAINNNGSSSNKAFSPLLNNVNTTPNHHAHTSQRLEDIEMQYDEILDEEEELERKLLRIQKKKMRQVNKALKPNGAADVYEGEDDEEEDDESFEDDFANHNLSGDEDLDDLHSYRQHQSFNHEGGTEFLNESTADFNKEIRQINQELREQLQQNEEIVNESHLSSLHSTQTVSTNQRKNPISFKLDLSKCKNQHDEDDNYIAGNEEGEELDGQFEIPGLQFVKVTDDSFRQLQKHSVRGQQIKSSPKVVIEQNKVQTLRESQQQSLQKNQQKQVVIPKLQLGVLQKGNQMSIPIKQSSQTNENKKKTIESMRNQIIADQILSAKQNSQRPVEAQQTQQKQQQLISQRDTCQSKECIKLRQDYNDLKSKYECDINICKDQLSQIKQVIDEIKLIFNFEDDISHLPTFIKKQIEVSLEKQQNSQQLQHQLDEIMEKYEQIEQKNQKYIVDIEIQKNQYGLKETQLIKKQSECEATIEHLKAQIQNIESRDRSNSFPLTKPEYQLSHLFETEDMSITRAKSTQNNEGNPMHNNPQYFYNTNLNEQPQPQQQQETAQIEEETNRKRKRYTCDIKKIKRPQSVANNSTFPRKSSAYKINNLIRVNSNVKDEYQNEYGADSNERNSLAQTMNKKVGIYIEKLKERNSSLQERLNVSLNHYGKRSQGSPVKFDLNITQIQPNNMIPSILSPCGVDTINKNVVLNTTQQYGVPSSTSSQASIISPFANNLAAQSKDNFKKYTDQALNLIDKHNEYSELEEKQQSKTQRLLQIKKVKYNQMMQSKSGLNNDSALGGDGEYSINFGKLNFSNIDPASSEGVYHMTSGRNIDSSRDTNNSRSSHVKNAFTNNHFNFRNAKK